MDYFNPANPISPLSPINPISPLYIGRDDGPAPARKETSESISVDAGATQRETPKADNSGLVVVILALFIAALITWAMRETVPTKRK